MGQSTDELRRDIERTREELGSTMDAIGARVRPGRIIERRKNRVTNSVRGVRERVMGTAHDMSDSSSHAVEKVGDVPQMMRERTQGAPMMAGALAFGIGFMLAAIFPATQSEQDASQKLMEKAQPLKDELTTTGKEMAEHLKEPAKEAANQLKDSAKESAQSVKDTATENAQNVKESTGQPQ